MDYKVLYRKYRPTNFDELVGQNHIKNILKNSIINNKIAHAYMFTGPRGTGKTSTAKIFARTLNCLNPVEGICCGECVNCLNINSNPDIIEMDAASNNSVDDIRNIIENVSIAPSNGKYKVYIIDEVHMLTQSAWNAFLKTLEEPPSNVIFILATTDIQKVPVTVLSRCQRFDFQRIDRNLIFDNLESICKKENINYETDALMEIAYLSDGCMRDALSILDQLSKVSDVINMDIIKSNYGTVTKDEVDAIYTSILKNNIDDLVKLLDDIKSTGIDIKILIDKLLENFINKAVDMKKKNVSTNAFNQLKKIIDALNNLMGKLNSNSNGYLMLELELINFINDDSNQITSREINQIISREIISVDTKFDVNEMIDESKNKQVYKICDNFIDVRINNSFVNCNKNEKVKFLNIWEKFIDHIQKNNINEFLVLTKGVTPQVVSSNYCLLVTNSESIKVVLNSKLYDIEVLFNSLNSANYHLIFISSRDWKNYMESYDKNKVYELLDESEYISNASNSIKLAEETFGNDAININ
jgi:DNA polymerase-3 subunit gamma/tau